MLRGQPKIPPSGDDLAVLNYHLNISYAHDAGAVRTFLVLPAANPSQAFRKDAVRCMNKALGHSMHCFRLNPFTTAAAKVPILF